LRLANETDFNGEIYTRYRWHQGFARRAELFKGFPEPILIVGCAFGYTVFELGKIGKLAWGIDASEWAIQNRVTDRVSLASILDPPRGEFETVITEDLLPYLTDDEAKIAAMNCSVMGSIVIHLVTVDGLADLNYHSQGYWMSLTNQLTVCLEGM
jgi:hypothetical protein